MELYRTIKTSFWKDRKIEEEFTPEDKYFYLYLFTNEHTNLLGCYELGIRQASKETGYDETTISRLFHRFENQHKVIKYNKDNAEVLLLNWHKHNWTKSPKFKNAILKQLNGVKTDEFKEIINTLYIPYIYPMHRVSNQETYPMHTSNTNTYTNTNTNTNTYTNPFSISEEEGYGKTKN